MSALLSRGATGKILYCIAWEKHENGKVLPQLDYVHANDRGEAWKQFGYSAQAQGCTRVIDIAPAVGYHVADSHGEKLTA